MQKFIQINSFEFAGGLSFAMAMPPSRNETTRLIVGPQHWPTINYLITRDDKRSIN